MASSPRSFRPEGASVPRSFVSRSGFTQYSRDRLVEVVDYTLAPTPSGSTILARDLDTGKTLRISIDKDALARAEQRAQSNRGEPAKWVGGMIDGRMRQHVPPGSWIVIERSKITRNLKEGGQPVSLAEANYIRHVIANPEKTFRSAITVSQYDGRIRNAQVWNDQAIDVNNEADLDKLGADLDTIANDYAAAAEQTAKAKEANPDADRVYPKSQYLIGFQLRTLVRDGEDKEGNPKFRVIDSSPPITWQTAQRDPESNEVVTPGRPIDRAYFYGVLKQYFDHVDANFPETDPNYGNVVLEVMPYREYRASKMSVSLQVPTHNGNPLFRMLNTPTRYSILEADEAPEPGQNWAVNGIIAFSQDVADQTTRQFIERNLVQSIHANGFIGSIHRMVKTADGHRAEPDPILDFKRDAPTATQGGPSAAYGAPAGAALAQGDSGLAAPDRDPFAFDSGADVYEQSLTGATGAHAAPPASTPADSTPPASTPADSTPADSTPADSTPAASTPVPSHDAASSQPAQPAATSPDSHPPMPRRGSRQRAT